MSDACKLRLNPNTAHRNLTLSEDRKMSEWADEQLYPDHPDRFDYWSQLLCESGLKGRCYWEVERKGVVHVAVTYKGIRRKGEFDDCCLGRNKQSWCLKCSDGGYSLQHNNIRTSIYVPPTRRVGVYLDWDAGTISFFSCSSDKRTHLHTFHTTFSEPVYPAFRVRPRECGSSLFLCQL